MAPENQKTKIAIAALKVAGAAVVFSCCGVYAARSYMPTGYRAPNASAAGLPFTAACAVLLGPRGPRAALWIFAVGAWYASVFVANLAAMSSIAGLVVFVYPPSADFVPVAIAGAFGGCCVTYIRNLALKRTDGLGTGALVGALAALPFGLWVPIEREAEYYPLTSEKIMILTRAFTIWQGVVGTYLAMTTWWNIGRSAQK